MTNERAGADRCAIAMSEKDLAAELPRVCLCCGAKAAVDRPKGFWRQAPVRSVPSRGIVGIIGAIRMLMQISEAASAGEHRLHAPFCRQHANYWSRGKLLLVARLGMVALFIGGLIVAAILALTTSVGAALAWSAACVVLMFLVAGLTIVGYSGRIEQMEPNPDFLILSNVSRAFRDALDGLRGQRDAVRVIPYSNDELASMQRRQRRWQIVGLLVLPGFATLAFVFVAGVLALVSPPSGLPKPAGGPQTRGNDLHCYDLLMRRDVTNEARSYLRGRPQETVEGWDHATTVDIVDQLYARGAQKVYYHPVLLLVVLPKDANARGRIFQWVFENVRKNKSDRIPDEQQSYLMVTPD